MFLSHIGSAVNCALTYRTWKSILKNDLGTQFDLGPVTKTLISRAHSRINQHKETRNCLSTFRYEHFLSEARNTFIKLPNKLIVRYSTLSV